MAEMEPATGMTRVSTRHLLALEEGSVALGTDGAPRWDSPASGRNAPPQLASRTPSTSSTASTGVPELDGLVRAASTGSSAAIETVRRASDGAIKGLEEAARQATAVLDSPQARSIVQQATTALDSLNVAQARSLAQHRRAPPAPPTLLPLVMPSDDEYWERKADSPDSPV